MRPSPCWVCWTCSVSPSLLFVEGAQALAEDDVVGGRSRVQMDHVVELVLALEAAQHRHDRRDPASGRDEEDALGPRLGEHELALDVGERDDRPGLELAVDVGRDLAFLDQLRGDREEPVRASRVGGDRVRAPVADAVDIEADAQVLAGFVPRPGVSRADEDGRRVTGLGHELLDAAAQLTGRPQRVDHLEVVVGQKRRGEGADRPQRSRSQRVHVGLCPALSHALASGSGQRPWPDHSQN